MNDAGENTMRCLISLTLAVLAIIAFSLPSRQTSAGNLLQAKRQVPAESIAKPIVTVARGESATIHIGWDKGTGRLPFFFLSADAEPTDDEKHADGGRLELSGEGISLSADQDAWGKASEQLRAANFYGRQPDGTYTHFSNFMLKIEVGEDAAPGVFRRYVHNVSGTGRHMILSAEVIVIVE